MNQSEFERELAVLLNKYSLDNVCNTPDYILAKFLTSHLAQVALLVKERDKWFGADMAIKFTGGELGGKQ